MMRTLLRLTWRLQRWEIGVLVGGSLVFAGIVAIVAWQASAIATDLAACYASGPTVSADCRSIIDLGNLLARLTPVLEGATAVVPFIAGILLGAPLVAREIEKGSASIAWSLSLSRARWLFLRAAPLLVVLAAALLLVGQATEALIRTAHAQPGFQDFGMYGPLIAARGMAVFCIGVLVGSWMGRVLPAILATGLVALALVLGLSLVRANLMEASATWVDSDSADFSGVLIYGVAYRDNATGKFVSQDAAFQAYPAAFGPEGPGIPPGLSQLYLATPPGLYPVFMAGEGGALFVIGALAAGASLWLLRTRRPELA